MHSYRALAFALAAVVGLSGSIAAQWRAYPDRDVPRKSDGSVNLEAPAPKTADGKIDFSGIWQNAWFVNGRVTPLPVSPPGEPPAATFADVFANFKGELPLQPWAAQLKAARKEQNSKDNPDAHCLPMGLMQFHMHPQPRKVLQTRDVIAILYEGNSGVRQIFIDGRPLPGPDAQPWWYGYSTGHWEGNTLVIETAGFRDGGWLDIYGSPLTDQAKMTERWQRLNYGSMQVDIAIDDPKAYTKPFSVRVHHRIAVDGPQIDSELIEFICNENNKAPQLMVGK
ncbi:MAG TPA: hypothetical protein VH436_29735 [Vicinamibacterales bacterium]